MAWLLFIGYVCCGGLGNLFYRAYQEAQESTEKKINRSNKFIRSFPFILIGTVG